MLDLIKKRRWGLSAIAVALMAAFVWSRSLASWNPQRVEPGVKISSTFIPFFMSDTSQGCWLRYRSDRLKNLENGRELAVPTYCPRDAVRFSPDGRGFVVIAGPPAHWDLEWRDMGTGKLRRSWRSSFPTDCPLPRDVQFSPDSRRLLVLANSAVTNLPLDGSAPRSQRFPSIKGDMLSPGGTRFLAQIQLQKTRPATKSRPKTWIYQLNVYDVQPRRLRCAIPLKEGYAQDWTFSPDGKLVAFTHDNDLDSTSTSVIDLQSGKQLWQSTSNLMSFSRDGQSLLVWSSFDEVAVRDAHDGEVTRRIELPDEMRDLALSSDGQYLYGISNGDSLWRMRLH